MAVFVLMIVAFLCKKFIIDILLFGPMSEWFPTNRLLAWLGTLSGIDALGQGYQNVELINTSMAGQLNLHLKISFATAIIIGFPYLAWELWRFVKPALTERELKTCKRFVFYLSLGFFLGLAFGYLMIAPLTVSFLSQYQISTEVVNLIDISSYLSTVLNVSLACAIVFQLPLLVYFLTRMGLLSPEFLQKYRRHAIIALSILAATITPPDAFSMIMVLIPLYGLYEYGIHISRTTTDKYNTEAKDQN